MEQLSGTDNFFLYTERGNVYNHVAALGIYDPSTAPGGKVRYKDILRYFGNRLGTNKVFRRRLVSVPHQFDRPYWLDDADPDLEFHIRHIALPHPGDWRQLMIQVARLHSRPLDRSRPLWEVYVIEGLDRIAGLPRGSFALFLKFHHASLDGQAAAAVLKAVHSLSPDPDEAPPEGPAVYAERDPTSIELYTRAVAHGAARTASISKLYLATLKRVAGVTLEQILRQIRPGERGAGEAPGLPNFAKAPPTRFNRAVSANRVVEAVGFPLAQLNRARAASDGATINDLFLAIVGGALRRYLLDKEELPEASLVALMPMSVRDERASRDGGNEVGGVPVPLHTELADSLERLAAVRRDAVAAKRDSEILGRGFVKSVLDELPAVAAEAFSRYVVLPQLNVTVSNVRGPDVSLYVAGARVVHFYPVSIATDYVGLNHTGFSYNGVLWISAVACRNMMPDPAFYADCLRQSFAELMAALAVPVAIGSRPAAAGRKSASHAKAKGASHAKAKGASHAKAKGASHAKAKGALAQPRAAAGRVGPPRGAKKQRVRAKAALSA